MPRRKTPARPTRRAKGEGSAYQRADGLWIAEITREGKRLRRSGKTKLLAEAKLATALGRSDPAAALEDPTVEEYLRAHYQTARDTKSLRDQTHAKYLRTATKWIFPAVGPVKVRDLTPRRVRALFNQVAASGRAVNTVRNVRTALAGALTQACEDGLIVSNPAHIKLPEGNSRTVVRVSIPEARRLLDAIREHPLRDIWALQLYAGMRLGEVLGLQWSDVRLADRQAIIKRADSRVYDETGRLVRGYDDPKTQAGQRVVPLPDEAVRLLWSRYHKMGDPKTGLLFESPKIKGTPPSPAWCLAQFKAALTAAGLEPIHQHDLRHWCATLLLGADPPVPIPVVSRLLGHANPSVTMRTYAHVIAEAERRQADKAMTFFPARDAARGSAPAARKGVIDPTSGVYEIDPTSAAHAQIVRETDGKRTPRDV